MILKIQWGNSNTIDQLIWGTINDLSIKSKITQCCSFEIIHLVDKKTMEVNYTLGNIKGFNQHICMGASFKLEFSQIEFINKECLCNNLYLELHFGKTKLNVHEYFFLLFVI